MADEHDRDEPDGPHRPSHVRRPTLQTEAPIPGGRETQHQLTPAQERTADGAQQRTADPRFANAPIALDEMKALHHAPSPEVAFAVLGHMQEDRLKDGRIATGPQPAQASPIDPMFTREEQVRLGIRPTPPELAHIQAGATPEAQHQRTMAFLATRTAHNRDLFERSRRWGPEIDRLSRAGHDDHRLRGEHGIQGWRADLPDAMREVGPGHFTKTSTSRGNAPDHAADERFLTAPLTKMELQALAMTDDPRKVARMLGTMQQARETDGRLQTAAPQREPALNSIVSPSQQIEMGLKPTPRQLMRMQAGSQAQEMQLANAFIAERQAANAYWQQRARQWSPQAQRDARAELTDKGLSRSQRAAAAREARTQRNRDDGNDRGNDGHDRGGRGR